MKRLYTLALSALVLAASATVAVPTVRMAKAKAPETLSERVESRLGITKVSQQRTVAYRMQDVAAGSVIKQMQKTHKRTEFAESAITSKLPVSASKVKAKAPGTVPATAEDLVAMQWESTYDGVFSAGSHSGVAAFSLDENGKLFLTFPDAPSYAPKFEVSYANGTLTIPGMAYAGTVSVQGVEGTCIAVSVPMTIDFATGQVTAPMEDVTVPFNAETQAFDFDPKWAWGVGVLDPEGKSYLGHLWAGYYWTLSVVDGDYSISVEAPEVCNMNNEFTFTVTLGEDVAMAKYLVMPVDAEASSYSSYIKESGTECVAGETYTVNPTVNTALDPVTESGYASVLFATFDAEGNLRKTTEQAFIVVVEGEAGWTNVGEIDYVDQLFADYYMITHSQKAMLQAKDNQPGLYRIVEPYSEFDSPHSADCHHHYFMLNIADPEWVEVPFSVSGLDLVGDGVLAFGTCAVLGYTKETGSAKGYASGTLEGQTVTFPVSSFFAREQYFNKPGTWSYCNGWSEVTFTFPDINLNVTVVDSNDAPVAGVTVALGEVSATTDAEGKATVKVPFETGYFATVTPTINDKEVEIDLVGAETDYTYTLESAVTPTPDPASVEILPTDFTVASPTAEAVKDGFTALAQKNNGSTAPAYNSGANAIRLYADNTLTISGKQITKVVFDIDAANNAKRYTTFTPSTGALTAEQAAGDTQVTWAGDAESVTFTVGKTAVYGTESEKAGQIHITKILVYGVPGSAAPQVYEVANIGEFLTAADAAHNTTITGEVTVTYQNGKYLFVTDATGSMEVYGSLDKTYANGTKLTGIAGKYSEYNNMPQMVPQTDSFTDGTAGDEVAPKETTLAEVALGEYVVVKGLSIVAEDDKLNVTDGITTKQLFNRFNIENVAVAENVTITGIGSVFGETQQLFPISIVSEGETPGPGPDPDPDPDPELTWTQLEGKGVYVSTVFAAMYGLSTDPAEVDVYECDQQKGVYKFVGVWPDLGDGFELVIDATDPDNVIVPEQNTGFVDNIDGITYIASVSALLEKAELEADAPELIMTMTDGYINIPADALMLRWPEAPADSQYETDPEKWYLGMSCPNGYALLPGSSMPDPNAGWKSVGNATLMDGWVTPLFADQTDPSTWFTVELQQNEANENLYRLVDPYHQEGFVCLEYNECADAGFIQFDVTDPELVVFATKVASGFGNAEAQVTNMYCANAIGSYMAFGFDAETVISILGDELPRTTFKDGVISLDFAIGVDPTTGEEYIQYDASFGPTASDPGYFWTDENGGPADMTARIWFPGVTPSYEQDSIHEITAEDGTKTVYNLRGQRVNKVTTPGIYIVNNRKVVVK